MLAFEQEHDKHQKQHAGMEPKLEKSMRAKQDLLDWLESIVVSVVCVVVIFSFFVRIMGVVGQSMEPTLHEGDRLLIQELLYEPKPGDVVICNKPNFSGKPFVKRVIALEGQTVDIDFDTSQVYVDGQLLEEDYLGSVTLAKPDDQVFPLTVPEGEIFVMGDNRQHSTDSRSVEIGTVDERYVVGRALLRIFPLDKIGTLER